MALSETSRARVILDLIKDGVVANEAAYELAGAAIATKYGQAVWDAYGPDVDANGNPITNPTGAQMSVFFIKRLRLFLKDALSQVRLNEAKTTAMATEAATVSSEVVTELGS